MEMKQLQKGAFVSYQNLSFVELHFFIRFIIDVICVILIIWNQSLL